MKVALDVMQPLKRVLDELHERYRSLDEGTVATYIPPLAQANPDHFGIAIATLDGYLYEIGDCDVPFTIQSISKPFVYGLALEDNGFEAVLGRIGVEPTGDAFNAISLDPDSGRPANPMINAGAIASTSLVSNEDGRAFERLMAMFGAYAGRELGLDEPVYRSESETGHRNRAISHMLRNFDIVTEDPERGLDLYFRQCSVSVTCRDLAIMAATLANRGVNPITDERALDAQYVDSVLSVMGSCGMYNYAGEWIYRVGMPAKSGVSGGVLACLAGQLGIGVYSPRLDARGNSVRGVHVCNDLSKLFSLHIHNVPNVIRACLRARYTASQVHSKRQRTAHEAAILAEQGSRARIYELQGHLNFGSVESFSRQVVDDVHESDFLAIDCKRILRMDPGGIALFEDLLRDLLASGKQIAISDSEHVRGLGERMEAVAAILEGVHLAENLDRAMEWCEDRLITAVDPASALQPVVSLEHNEFFAGMDSDDREQLLAACIPMGFDAGTTVIRANEACRSVYFLTRGEVSMVVDLPYQEHVRLATYSAGMAFGYRAVFDVAPQEADYIADTDIECHVLTVDDLESIGRDDPQLAATIYRTFGRNLARQLDEAAAEIRALSL